MAHTQTWNAAYQAVPANGDDASEGALRIRNLKRDIQERLAIDHVMDETNNDGKHNTVTMPVQGSAPTNIASTGILYTKDVSAKAELFFIDEDGNEVQLSSGGSVLNPSTLDVSGTKLISWQTTAPTGWTKDTTKDNHALRVETGTIGSGGATNFTSVFGSGKNTGGTTLTAAQSGLPSHNHDAGTLNVASVTSGSSGGPNSNTAAVQSPTTTFPVSGDTGSTGGTAASSSHNHSLSLDLKYQDVNMITKD